MKIANPDKNKIFTIIWLLISALSALIMVSLPACENKSSVRGLVVNPEFSDKVLSDNLVTKLRVKFITTSAFQPSEKDYRIVAEADWQGKFLFKESLDLQPPTSKWLPNRVYEIEKYVYFPAFINRFDPETAGGVRVNFSIRFEEAGQVAPVVLFKRTLRLSPCPLDAPDVVYFDGWEKIIRAWPGSDKPLAERWTQKQAVCLLKNSGRGAILMIKGQAVATGSAKQKVSLFLEDRLLDEFELEPGPFEKIYSLTAADLGQEPELRLTIAVDKTIKASEIYREIEKDREVGIKIETIYFR